MKKHYCVISLTALFLFTAGSALAAAPQSKHRMPPPYLTNTNLNLPVFTSINVSGNIYVKLTQQPNNKMPVVTIEGKNFQNVAVSVKDHTLYLRRVRTMAPNHSPSFVTVKMGTLNSVILKNKASLTAEDFKAKNLYINAHTSGFVNLSGMVDIDKITSYGSGNIKLGWLNSPSLTIYNAGSGKISISGIAGTVHARLVGHAQLNAQYLRAQNIWVQTKDFATAKVLPVESLRAFALDNSNIYFYKRPQHLTRYTENSGNVLQFAWRN